jgi:hypothetical protein
MISVLSQSIDRDGNTVAVFADKGDSYLMFFPVANDGEFQTDLKEFPKSELATHISGSLIPMTPDAFNATLISWNFTGSQNYLTLFDAVPEDATITLGSSPVSETPSVGVDTPPAETPSVGVDTPPAETPITQPLSDVSVPPAPEDPESTVAEAQAQ